MTQALLPTKVYDREDMELFICKSISQVSDRGFGSAPSPVYIWLGRRKKIHKWIHPRETLGLLRIENYLTLHWSCIVSAFPASSCPSTNRDCRLFSMGKITGLARGRWASLPSSLLTSPLNHSLPIPATLDLQSALHWGWRHRGALLQRPMLSHSV